MVNSKQCKEAKPKRLSISLLQQRLDKVFPNTSVYEMQMKTVSADVQHVAKCGDGK